MKKFLPIIALATALSVSAQDAELKSLTVGDFDEPGKDAITWGNGSYWEKQPFQWYTKYCGQQAIYTADYLKALADDNGAITEVVFKYGDEGSYVELTANLTLYIENYDATEFVKKPETEKYMWYDYDPTTSSSNIEYATELYYLEDQEIHFVLDKPLQYEGKSLLVTMWSERTSEDETLAINGYGMHTAGYTSMLMADDLKTFEQIYDTGVQVDYMSPLKEVPVVKFVYTTGDGIADATVDNSVAPATFYNLQGVEMKGELAPGLYIRRQGDNVAKVVVK